MLFLEPSSQAVADPMEKLSAFIEKREAIRRRREEGRPGPWTSDGMLMKYCFCNIHREDDRTTREIAAMYREPYKADLDLWFALTVARFVNWVPTLIEIGWPVPWDPDHFLDVIEDRKKRGEKVESTAYKIRPDNHRDAAGKSKFSYIAHDVLTPLWESRKAIRPKRGDYLEAFCAALMKHEGIGPFMAGQIIADLKYVDPLRQARDWWSFAVSGPGSRPGLNRLLGRPPNAPWTEAKWFDELQRLAAEIAPDLKRIGMGRLHNQDLQNAICEFNRYEKLRLGEGIARRYHPAAANIHAVNPDQDRPRRRTNDRAVQGKLFE